MRCTCRHGLDPMLPSRLRLFLAASDSCVARRRHRQTGQWEPRGRAGGDRLELHFWGISCGKALLIGKSFSRKNFSIKRSPRIRPAGPAAGRGSFGETYVCCFEGALADLLPLSSNIYRVTNSVGRRRTISGHLQPPERETGLLGTQGRNHGHLATHGRSPGCHFAAPVLEEKETAMISRIGSVGPPPCHA